MRTTTSIRFGLALLSAASILISCSTSDHLFQPTSLSDSAYDRFGGVYHTYIYDPGETTPVPSGFKPFYISHIGRHGSRYPVDRPYVMTGLSRLQECGQAGILTSEGEKLLEGFRKLDSLCTGVYGYLDAKGAQEHKDIASRMYENYPGVFHQKDRDSVAVQSTHRQRCLMSSWNFCTTLRSKAPGIRMGLVAGDKYYDILSNAETKEITAHNKPFNQSYDEHLYGRLDVDAFYERMFTDTQKAAEIVSRKGLLLETCYTNGSVALYLGVSDIVDAMTPQEYEAAARVYSGKMNCQHCNSAENGDFRVFYARPLLGDFIDKADSALEGNGVAADLRFTHDTGMMPFFGLIGIEGYDRGYTYDEAADNWDSTRLMCMATNLQAVFYRNRKGDVKVKLLLNERETSIPALGEGPFYDWEDLRAYLVSKMD